MFEGFEIVEEEHDFVIVNKEQQTKRMIVVQKSNLQNDFENLLHKNKIITTQLTNIVYSMEKAGITGNDRELWLAAANCVIKCMKDVIIEGEKLIKDTITVKEK